MNSQLPSDLYIRPMSEQDVDRLLEMESDPSVMQFTSGRITPTLERRQDVIHYLQQARTDTGHWAVEKKGNFIGWVSLTNWKPDGRHQIAYRFCASEWGNGYATTAASALVDYAFTTLNISALVAVVWPDNLASAAVLRKLNFKYEKDALNQEVIVHLYSRLR
ncbi:GNAT family N-acetyltransferase [Stenotrophobium rhamnosiphilum]|uniref:N-acetyltransferase n=1 Tax=Stenotrophobium rhamnosiphilum TaxID=2029166 RepID=A0A2T5MIZ3_9GAMM|nr:GNAT family N-acetyltransferase [Stenotrophobium rhamnosiphilum]PTU32553.1 N-acetyltransferase [Stenotrophobium rhamnosiphilum]